MITERETIKINPLLSYPITVFNPNNICTLYMRKISWTYRVTTCIFICMYTCIKNNKKKQEEIKITLTTKEDDFLFRNKIMSYSPSLSWPRIWYVF